MDPDTYIEAVLRKAETLKKVDFWVPQPNVRPRAWLNNFEDDEREIAAAIVDSLIYFPEQQTNALLKAGYRDIVDDFAHSGSHGVDFGRNAIFTRVDGEEPNPSDSGNVFCRKARNVLTVDESRLVEPRVALEQVIANRSSVVFLDDFLGSGNQIYDTWVRPYRASFPTSFADAYVSSPFAANYLVLVATADGLTNTTRRCAGLTVRATHVLGDEYSVRKLHELPHIPPIQNLADRVHKLLERYAPRLELQAFMRQSDFALYGFHSLGLLLAFQHGCPDASIPLIWASAGSGWSPLVVPA